MFFVLASLYAITAAPYVRAVGSDDLLAKVLSAATQSARFADLKPTDFRFDFNKSPRLSGKGGFLTAMTLDAVPALLTGNGAMAIGVLGPCGLNAPHTHPRATEISIILNEGPVDSALVMEDGVAVVQNNLSVGQAIIFPQGSMHYLQNLGCKTTTFIASFDNSDFGGATTSADLGGLISTPEGAAVVSAALGIQVEVLEHLQIPSGIALGAQECRTRCGLTDDFNFTATFKDYAIFSNSTWETSTPSISGSPSPSKSSTSSASSVPSGSASTSTHGASTTSAANKGLLVDEGSINIPFWQNPLHPHVIGLSAASGALLIVVIGLLITMARRRSGRRISNYSQAYRSVSPRSAPLPYPTPYEDSETFTARPSVEK